MTPDSTPLDLGSVEPGRTVFIDAPIFIYHFTGRSSSCRRFLERCERGEVEAVTSVTILAEVSHRLMTIEAVERGLVASGNVVRKLREQPRITRELFRYRQLIERIPLLGIEIIPLRLEIVLRAFEVQLQSALLTNDALAAASAFDRGITAIASADRDFDRVAGLERFTPHDLD